MNEIQAIDVGETVEVIKLPSKCDSCYSTSSNYMFSYPDNRVKIGDKLVVTSKLNEGLNTRYGYRNYGKNTNHIPHDCVKVERDYKIGDEYILVSMPANPAAYASPTGKSHIPLTIGDIFTVSGQSNTSYPTPFYITNGLSLSIPTFNVVPHKPTSQADKPMHHNYQPGDWVEVVNLPVDFQFDGMSTLSNKVMELGEKFQIFAVPSQNSLEYKAYGGLNQFIPSSYVKPFVYKKGDWFGIKSSGEKFEVLFASDEKVQLLSFQNHDTFIHSISANKVKPCQPRKYNVGDRLIVVKPVNENGLTEVRTTTNPIRRGLGGEYAKLAVGEVITISNFSGHDNSPCYRDARSLCKLVPIESCVPYNSDTFAAVTKPIHDYKIGDKVRVDSVKSRTYNLISPSFFKGFFSSSLLKEGEVVKIDQMNENEKLLCYKDSLLSRSVAEHRIVGFEDVSPYQSSSRINKRTVITFLASSIFAGVIAMQPFINLLNEPQVHDAIVKVFLCACGLLIGIMGLNGADRASVKLSKLIKWNDDRKHNKLAKAAELDSLRLAALMRNDKQPTSKHPLT